MAYCGLDRRRLPLVGDEIRVCWEAVQTTTAGDAPTPEKPLAPGFVPVDEIVQPAVSEPPRWSLWADLES